MSLFKSRQCSESCMELLAVELVHYYARQTAAPSAAAIDAVGYRVGRQLAERYTANRPRLGEPLEVIKFICKEFWAEVFRKQVDNLRTNHRGTFVLKDAAFRWLAKLSLDSPPQPGSSSASSSNGSISNGAPGPPPPLGELARNYLVLPCAIVRGALMHLGVECTVTADASNLPACDFTVNIKSR